MTNSVIFLCSVLYSNMKTDTSIPISDQKGEIPLLHMSRISGILFWFSVTWGSYLCRATSLDKQYDLPFYLSPFAMDNPGVLCFWISTMNYLYSIVPLREVLKSLIFVVYFRK